MANRKLTFDDFQEIRELREKLVELQVKKTELQKVRQEGEARWAAQQRVDRVEDKASALVKGEAAEGPTVTQEDLDDLRQQVAIYARAITMVEDELKRTEARASREICENLRPEFVAAWEAFGETLVQASEQASALMEKYDQLRGQGILFSGALPVCFPLETWDGRDPDSKVNRAVSEIGLDWDLSIDRPVMERAMRARHDAHLAEERRKAKEKEEDEKERQRRIKEGHTNHQEFLRGLGMPA